MTVSWSNEFSIRRKQSMAVKSTTQMTKSELLNTIAEKNRIIADLNQKIDELENMAVQSTSVPLDADVSRLLGSMNARIRELENLVKTT
jgi:hypothetical protein